MKITKKKNTDYYYTVVELPRLPGEKRQRKFIYGKSQKEVRNKATKLIQDIETNQYVKDSKETLEAYLDKWFSLHKDKITDYTAKGYEVNIKKHINPNIGHIKLNKLMPIEIQTLYDKLLKTGNKRTGGGLSATSIKYIHRVLNKALNDAVRMQFIIRNPCDAVVLPKMKKPKVNVLSESQIKYFLDSVKGHKLEPAIHLAVSLGLRRGEILGLTWDNVDLENNKIIIKQQLIYTNNKEKVIAPVKSDESNRILYMPDSLIAIFNNHIQRQESNKEFFGNNYHNYNLVVCRDDGSPYLPGSFSHTIEYLVKRVGVGKTTLHGLRHAYATLHAKYNTNIKILSSTLGHTDIRLTQNIYQDVLDDMKKEVAVATEKILYTRDNNNKKNTT